MEKQLKSEIKNILMGRVVTDSDGWLVVAEGHSCLTFYGIINGEMSLGITTVHKNLQVATDSKSALQKMCDAFQEIGEMTVLKNEADTLACLCRKCFRKPALLTAKNIDGGKVLLSVHTQRGILSRFICKKRIKSIEKKLHP